MDSISEIGITQPFSTSIVKWLLYLGFKCDALSLDHCSRSHQCHRPFHEHPVSPGDAVEHTSLLRTPCHTGRRGVKTHKSSKNTLLHRATRKNTHVFQEHPVTPGDAEWKHPSLVRTPCYTGRRGMKTPKSCKNTLLHRATRNENTQVL